MSDPGTPLVIIPTHNERENLRPITHRLRAAVPAAAVLIIDDASPDGTGEIADQLAAEDDNVNVLHRAAKLGLGSAYVEGFRWGLDRGFPIIVEMDADGSHQPEELPGLLHALSDADIAIGSRWVEGAQVMGLTTRRVILSRVVQAYSQLLLGLSIRDLSSGFRAYRADGLGKIDLDLIESAGFCFQVEILARMAWLGMRVVEIPITFGERMHGHSKMSSAIVLEGMRAVARWGVSHRLHSLRWTRDGR